MKAKSLLAMLAPGILVAATGVGAGDLATGALVGNRLGTAVLWAVLVGAFFKFVLTEGLTRWQLATGETILEGAFSRLGKTARNAFLIYFLIWSFLVATALMSACGVATHAILPVFSNASTGKVVFGIGLSVLAAGLVRFGGFRLFEKVMGVCIALMFVTVVVTAVLLRPDWGEFASGLVRPSVPDLSEGGLGWTVALIGGVGGTVTILCYGYWIREKGRVGPHDLNLCRLDLAVAYLVTAVFGLAMVLIGSTIQVEGSGATLVVALGEKLLGQMGPAGKWIFLIGAWGAVFSSMLGVWQSVPYLFADFWRLDRGDRRDIVRTDSFAYRGYLYAVAVIPMIGLLVGFSRMQKLYAIFGACFIPLLALALLLLNGRSQWVGRKLRNRPLTSLFLVLILLFFLGAAWLGLS